MVQFINCISIKHVQSQKEKENWRGGYNGLGREVGSCQSPFISKKSPQGPLANIKSLDKFSLTNEIGNKENEKKKKKKRTLQIIMPPRCRILHLRFDP